MIGRSREIAVLLVFFGSLSLGCPVALASPLCNDISVSSLEILEVPSFETSGGAIVVASGDTFGGSPDRWWAKVMSAVAASRNFYSIPTADATALLVSPYFSSLDSKDTHVAIACTDNGIVVTETTMHADYTGPVTVNHPWHSLIRLRLALLRDHAKLEAQWISRLANGVLFQQAHSTVVVTRQN